MRVIGRDEREEKSGKTSDKVERIMIGEGKSKALGHGDRADRKGFRQRLDHENGRSHKLNVESIPTGVLSLDLALGSAACRAAGSSRSWAGRRRQNDSVPARDRRGAERGGTAAFIDAEHSLDPSYARKLGVDVENLLISQPDYGEQALEIAETLIRSGAIDMIVVDSVAALSPKRRSKAKWATPWSACRPA